MATLNGSLGNDTIVMTSGIDTVSALDGTDKIFAAGYLRANDKVDGGAKVDTVVLDGDYSTPLLFNSTTLSNIEILELYSGHDYAITTHDATVSANADFKVGFTGDATAGGRLIFDGSAEKNGHFDLYGAAANDILKGGWGDDRFTIGSGNDVVTGNAGNDTIFAKSHLTASDKIAGGDGDDLLRLEGNYSQLVTFASTTLQNVEYIHLVTGHDYALKTHDANVAAGKQLSINMIDGEAGRLVFDGSAEKDGKFGIAGTDGDDLIKGGSGDDVFWMWQDGDDVVTGGSGDDTAIFNDGYTTADIFTGGAGYDTLVVGAGTGVEITFDPATISSVEEIDIDKKDNSTTALTTFDAMVADGATLKVDFMWGGGDVGQALGFNGNAETDGSFDITGGSGDDVLIGGAKNDLFWMYRGGDDIVSAGDGDDKIDFAKDYGPGDIVDGGQGKDQLHINGFNGTAVLSDANVKSIESIYVTSSLSSTVKVMDSLVGSDQTMNISAGYMAAGTTFILNASAEADATFGIMGHAGTDIIHGGGGRDDVDLRDDGADMIYTGGGDDLIRAINTLDVTDVFNGGAGRDSLALNGDYLIALKSDTIRNIESLSLSAGHDYELYLHKDTIGAGQTLTVAGYHLDKTDTLMISDTAGDTGALDVRAGSTFRNVGSAVRAGSSTDDRLYLDGDYSSELKFSANKLLGVETLGLGAGHSYNLVSHDNTVAAGKSMEVIGYWLGATDSLIFDGSAETNGSFNISGGAGNDIMKGGAGNDTLRIDTSGDDTAHGGAGDDVFDVRQALGSMDRIDGGSGYDTLQLDKNTNANLGGSALKDIEKVELRAGHTYKFTVFDALLDGGETFTVDQGNLAANDFVIFNGTAETNGSFYIRTGDAADDIKGGLGADFISTSSGQDLLTGGGGNDVMDGGSGGDVIAGGDGRDLVTYEKSSGSVKISLAANSASGGDATGDALTGIEDLKGSKTSDTLTGNSGANRLDGFWGDDTLAGGAGADMLTGGSGNDTASYKTSAEGVFVSLTAGIGAWGEAAGDKLLQIENVIGSSHADTIHGNNAQNVLTGGNGEDTLSGLGDGDRLDGGSGNDTLIGGAGGDVFIFKGANWGSDTITDFVKADFDKIDLSGHDLAYGDLHITYAGGDATIATAHGTIVLEGIASGLTAYEFIF